MTTLIRQLVASKKQPQPESPRERENREREQRQRQLQHVTQTLDECERLLGCYAPDANHE